KPAPLASTTAPSLTVHPAGIPDRVALSVSSLSPAALSPLSVIAASSLPCHTVVAPNTGSSATPLPVTPTLAIPVSVTVAVGPFAVSLDVTDSVNVSASSADGGTSVERPSAPDPAVQVPLATLAAPSPLNDQLDGTPPIVAPVKV